MVQRSNKWDMVEEKLAELRGLVNNKWDNQEWQFALEGESIIRSVEKSKAASEEMRKQTGLLMESIKKI
jgi:hypothetical protein